MANTPNLDLENIVILDDAKKAYEQIVTEIIGKTNRNTAKLDTKSLQKADVTYVDTKVASVVNGSPKGTFATLALLQANATANTVEGKKCIYLVTADNNWYYWNGTAWTAGGIYLISKANQITLIDEGGYFDSVNVEDALQEVGQDIETNKTDILTLNEIVGSVAMTTVDQTLKGAINEVVSDITDLDTQQSQVLINFEAEKQPQLASNYMKRIEDYANIISMPNNASGNVDVSLGGMSLNNELLYNRDTWAEWTKSAGVVGDSTGLELTTDGINYISVSLAVNLKTSTKYGLLYNIVSSNVLTAISTTSSSVSAFPWQTLSKVVGNNKQVMTTKSAFEAISYLKIMIENSAEVSGNKIKFNNNIRLYELPTGSQIEADFTNLTADQLAIKYPYIKGDSTKNVCGSGKMVFKGKNLFNPKELLANEEVSLTTYNGRECFTWKGDATAPNITIMENKFKNNTQYVIKCDTARPVTSGDILYFVYTDGTTTTIRADTLDWTTKTVISTSGKTIKKIIGGNSANQVFYFDFNATQLEKGLIATPIESYVENTTYFQSKENNLIVENRMLPNLIKDEFYYSKVIGKWKRKKNVKPYTLLASDITGLDEIFADATWVTVKKQLDDALYGNNVTNLSTALQKTVDGFRPISARNIGEPIGGQVNYASDRFALSFAKGTTLVQAQTALIGKNLTYQLATPIISDIDSIGEPRAYPNGSAEFTPCLWGYTSTSSTVITDTRYPIKSITKVIRLEVVKGKLVETDVTVDATISTDLLSLNIANIDITKSYFYECEIDSQYTTNAYKVLDIEVNNGVITHDYLASVADWVLTANEANATMLVCTNVGGNAKIIAPAKDGKIYIVKNDSGQTITVKTASSTGITIPNGFVETVSYTGSDYIKVVKDTQKIATDVEVNKFPAKNEVINGDISKGTTGWINNSNSSLSALNNTLLVTGGNILLTSSIYTKLLGMLGKNVYIKGLIRVTNSSCTSIRMRIAGAVVSAIDNPVVNTWYTISGIISNVTIENLIVEHAYVDAATANGKVMEVKYVIAIDLLATFGAGNEPTVAEMNSILSKFQNGWFDGTVEQLLSLKEIFNFMLKQIRALQ